MNGIIVDHSWRNRIMQEIYLKICLKKGSEYTVEIYVNHKLKVMRKEKNVGQ